MEGGDDVNKLNSSADTLTVLQQYIKDLEARVNLYDSSHDEQIEKLRTGMRALLEENHQLRGLLAGVAGFVVSTTKQGVEVAGD